MNQTAIDLWNDKGWLKKQLLGIQEYMDNLNKRFHTVNFTILTPAETYAWERKSELYESAYVQRRRFSNRLLELGIL